jgi:tetratricopeptide (TPR) repeat protein
LKGRYYWNLRSQDGLRKAEQYFKEAIQKDPQYGQAYAGLADTYILFANFNISAPGQAYTQAREMSSQAIQIDSTLAEPHTSLATLKAVYDWDWSGAEQEFRRAIEMNPSYATAHHWYAEDLLIRMGRQAEALEEIERARQLDPLSRQINAVQARLLSLSNQNDKAIEQGRKALELDPSWAAGHWWLALAYEQIRQYPEALVELQKAVSLNPINSTFVAALGHAYAVSGQKSDAAKILQHLQILPKRSFVSAFDIALLHAGLGNKDEAFLWLAKGCDERDYWISTLAVEPRLEPLRADPRFRELLRRIGLSQ